MHKKLMIFSLIFLALMSGIVWGDNSKRENINSIQGSSDYHYLALGDSYTIGESVEANERWPVQLSDTLNKIGVKIESTRIIAKTGWRTDEILAASMSNVKDEKFDLVSLLIGVNNEYQGWEPSAFEPEFRKSLDFAIDHCLSGTEGVIVLSIPDYGYTPFGEKNMSTISSRIDHYNEICKRISKEKNVVFFDITPISRKGLKQPSLVAGDGLHPSSEQYKLWVDKIIDEVYQMIKL